MMSILRADVLHCSTSARSIDDVNTSCRCTTVEYSREPVQSGKTVDITVVYKAEYPEHFNKTITVYCNSPVSPLQLKIKGDAK